MVQGQERREGRGAVLRLGVVAHFESGFSLMVQRQERGQGRGAVFRSEVSFLLNLVSPQWCRGKSVGKPGSLFGGGGKGKKPEVTSPITGVPRS